MFSRGGFHGFGGELQKVKSARQPHRSKQLGEGAAVRGGKPPTGHDGDRAAINGGRVNEAQVNETQAADTLGDDTVADGNGKRGRGEGQAAETERVSAGAGSG